MKESEEWERFKTETKKQFMVFLKASKYGDATKHVISDTLDGIHDHAKDVMATLSIVGASKTREKKLLLECWLFSGNMREVT
jgi:hypothetical protein